MLQLCTFLANVPRVKMFYISLFLNHTCFPWLIRYFWNFQILWAFLRNTDKSSMIGGTKPWFILTLPVPIPVEEKKTTSIFILALLCGASEGFMKALKAFIKPFEAPQRSVKIKIGVNFYFNINFLNVQDGKG